MKKRIFAMMLALGLLAGCAPAKQPNASEIEYEKVVLYLPGESADTLTEKEVQVAQNGEAAPALVQTLAAEGALPAGSDVRKWSMDEKDTATLSVDLNKTFAEAMLTTGTAGEAMVIQSLVNTLWAYYTPDVLVLTANGKPIETGHNIYDEPFTAPYPAA